MTVSYRTKQDHLQINCSPVDYVLLLEQKGMARDEYLAVLPRYLISRCPFCAATRAAQVDTYSLKSWYIRTVGHGGSFGAEAEPRGCQHFNRVQKFFNLEGVVPVEGQTYESILHIPFVMPFYLPDDVPAIAVIHSLPVCRIEDEAGWVYSFDFSTFREPIAEVRFNKERAWKIAKPYVPFAEISAEDKARLATAHFVPRYTGFAVTYYTSNQEDATTLVGNYIDTYLTEDNLRDPDYTMADLRTMESMEGMNLRYSEGYDLADWVRKGKLQWLDLDEPDLPLKAGPIEDFPYTNIYSLKEKRIPIIFGHDFFS